MISLTQMTILIDRVRDDSVDARVRESHHHPHLACGYFHVFFVTCCSMWLLFVHKAGRGDLHDWTRNGYSQKNNQEDELGRSEGTACLHLMQHCMMMAFIAQGSEEFYEFTLNPALYHVMIYV